MRRRFVKSVLAAGALIASAVVPVVTASSSSASSAQWAGASRFTASPAIVSAPTINCTTTITGPITFGAVVVPPGASCSLVDVTVTGSVAVLPGGGLFVVGSTIEGSLNSARGRYIAIGNLREFGGPSQISQIWGSVSISGTTSTPGFPTKNVICDSTFVAGTVQLTSNRAPFAVGTDPDCFYPGTSPSGDTIEHSLQITSTAGQVTVYNDLIDGSLACTSNVPTPLGSGNTVLGGESGQCTGF
jgi:hypothetical protein